MVDSKIILKNGRIAKNSGKMQISIDVGVEEFWN